MPSAPIIGTPLTLAAARALAAEVTRQRSRDLDVVADYKVAKRKRREASRHQNAHTFALTAADFLREYKVPRKGIKPRRWHETERLLGFQVDHTTNRLSLIKDGLSDRWQDKPISSVTFDDVSDIIAEVRRTGIYGLERRNNFPSDRRGRRMADALCLLFKWLHMHRRISHNPCAGIHRPPTSAARDRVLNVKGDVRKADELRWFWKGCDALGLPFGTLFKLLLLTGCRLNEIARMTRDELSDDFEILRLTGDRTKNGRPHNVPMPPIARQLLRKVAKDGFVFTTNEVTPVSGFSKIKRRLDAEMQQFAKQERGGGFVIPAWRVHDLRRTAATGMAGIGISPHIVEAVLNHVSGAKGGVAGTYNREAYEPEKRAATDRWARHIASLVK